MNPKLNIPMWIIALAVCACAYFLWNISVTLPQLSTEVPVVECPEPVPNNVTVEVTSEPVNGDSFKINYQLVDSQGGTENYHAVWYENEAPVSPGGSLGTILIKKITNNPNGNNLTGSHVVTPGPISSEGYEIQIVKDYDGSEDKDVQDPRM